MEQCFLLRSNDEQRGLRPGLRRPVFVSAIVRGQIRLTAVSSGGTVNALISPPGTELRRNTSLASRFNIIPSSFGESGGSIPTLADSQKQASGVVQKTVKNGEKSKQLCFAFTRIGVTNRSLGADSSERNRHTLREE
jgi:hypothetical protein